MINKQSIILFFVSYVLVPRLTFLPKSVHTLLTVFGPFLLPWLINQFNTARATSRSVPVRPVPPKVQRALNLLFVSALGCLVLSLPYFAPENIFLKTGSRLQIEGNVLFTRLKLLRPLTAEDEVLRTKLSGSGQNKLYYLAYGPDSLINCVWCSTTERDDAPNYLYYTLPKIIAPHILQLAVLGLATSSLVGSEGSRFRIPATIAGLALLVVETWYLATYDVSANKRAKTLQEIDFVYWRLRFLRFFSFAVTDGIFAAVLWATSTNRWLAKSISIAERLETSTRQAEDTLHKLRALGLLTNSINRDPALRGVREEYWRTEGQVMAETVQEQEVMEQINMAITRLDFASLQNRVSEVADGIMSGIDGLKASQDLTASVTSEVSSS